MEAKADRHLFDRRLHLTVAVVFAVLILFGFGRTYYFGGLFDAPPLPSPLAHVHAVLMTAWVALFVVQVRLIGRRAQGLHRRIGYTAIGLATLIIVTGVPTAVRAAKYGSNAAPPDIPPLSFLAVPLFDLVMFALLFGGAIYYRRQPAAHKSLMLLTAVNFLPPALGRNDVFGLGPLWFLGVPVALALTCLWLEARHYGRLNRVFAAGVALFAASYVVRLTIMGTETWLAFASWLVSFV